MGSASIVFQLPQVYNFPSCFDAMEIFVKVLFILLAQVLLYSSLSLSTPLDDYVWEPDEHYTYYDLGQTISGRSVDGSHHWTGYLLNMTSQQWLTPEGNSAQLYSF